MKLLWPTNLVPLWADLERQGCWFKIVAPKGPYIFVSVNTRGQRGVEPRKYAGFVHIQVCYVRALAQKNPGIWGSSHKKIRKRGNFTQKNAKKNATKSRFIWFALGDVA